MSFDNVLYAAVIVIVLDAIANLYKLFRKGVTRVIEVPVLTIHLVSNDEKALHDVADRMREMIVDHIAIDSHNGSIRTESYVVEDPESQSKSNGSDSLSSAT